MRECNNCEHVSCGLDCNTGVESLYCRETEYEIETLPNNVCEFHQFEEGYEDEYNYLLYDESYLGPGYFFIHETDGVIDKFFKIYISSTYGFPNYGIRAYSGNLNCEFVDEKFKNIKFLIRSHEDFDIFYPFVQLNKYLKENLYSIDDVHHGENNVSISRKSGIIEFVVSKDNINGKQHPSKFIDINLGDYHTCKNYDAINGFYNSLASICKNNAREEGINKILILK